MVENKEIYFFSSKAHKMSCGLNSVTSFGWNPTGMKYKSILLKQVFIAVFKAVSFRVQEDTQTHFSSFFFVHLIIS